MRPPLATALGPLHAPALPPVLLPLLWPRDTGWRKPCASLVLRSRRHLPSLTGSARYAALAAATTVNPDCRRRRLPFAWWREEGGEAGDRSGKLSAYQMHDCWPSTDSRV